MDRADSARSGSEPSLLKQNGLRRVSLPLLSFCLSVRTRQSSSAARESSAQQEEEEEKSESYLLLKIINSAHSLSGPYWTDMAGLNTHSKSARCHLLPALLDCIVN